MDVPKKHTNADKCLGHALGQGLNLTLRLGICTAAMLA